ncbi:MAG: 50S ribosome-binding GTPase [Microbacterium sp.]|uniref:GTPase n=1 Tax=Microbacterium sp. TaxID=51671 RepID=UPI00199111C6|nr:GTPase [Microbacterium sp.]MBD3757970.1 50S ribosome-binding GTPase [Microbacterium sp.]
MTEEIEPSQIDETPFIEGTANAKSRYGRFNLAVIGGTGVGKSSLINAVFGRDLAKVGKGLPVTRGVQYYSDDSLGIWDIEGFEIGSTVPPAKQLRGHLAEIARHPKNQQISVVWYCVKSNDDRLTPADVAMIGELSRAGLPVILVLTKVDWSKNPITGQRGVSKSVEEFVDWLENPVDENGQPISIGYERVILTSTSDKHGKGKGHGLGELVAETLTLSPEDEKDAFRIAQRLNLPWKRELARPIVSAAAVAAAGAAAVPLPVADAVTLAPIQLGMMARISVIYDIEMKTALSTSALANLGAQLAGRALASSLIKLIPGAGSVINAGVAAALTGATGEGWLRLCEQVHTGKIDLDQMNEAWGDYVPGFLDVIRKMATQRLGK